MATLIVLLDQDVFPAWMVAAIVARELLISGLRQAAIERGVVIAARDLGKLKTWSQAVAAAVGGLAAAGAWTPRRVVDAARRARADVDLGARLREVGAESAARPRCRLSVERLLDPGLPPRVRLRLRAVEQPLDGRDDLGRLFGWSSTSIVVILDRGILREPPCRGRRLA